jgi:hypothetical protein
VVGLRVNSLPAPICIDDPRPHFSFKLDGGGRRGVASEGYEIILRGGGGGHPVDHPVLWSSGKVSM